MKNTKVLPFLAATLLTASWSGVAAQDKYFTRNGSVSFSCGTALETIDAANAGASCVLVASTGQVQAAVLMRAFEFDKDLMEQHFNENYVESDKFPKSTFSGRITNMDDVNLKADGKYAVRLAGDMSLHGVTRSIEADGTIEVRGGLVVARAELTLPLKDYDISIPGVVKDKIAESATVNMTFDLKPLEARP